MRRGPHQLQSLFWLIALISLAREARARAEEKPFEVTADLTYASLYMTDGFRMDGGNAVLEPSLNLKLLGGFSFLFWSALPVDLSASAYEELDFIGRYTHNFAVERPYAFSLHGYVDYWLYPRTELTDDGFGDSIEMPTRQGNKVNAGASLWNLIHIAGAPLVPTYNLYYWFYWAGNQKQNYQGGAHHEFLLEYAHQIPAFIPGTLTQYLGWAASLNYNDGAFGVQPGWSHSTMQLGTTVYAAGCSISASLNRQWSYVPSVDPQDELWTMLSLTRVF